MARNDKTPDASFNGFDKPESNWFRMPNSWTDITAEINSIAELKVVEYILRHTWGYQEYGIMKHITIDEFVNGRRRQEGGRMDRGTGLSERAVYDGIRKAVEDGLIEEESDTSDRGRVKKSYSLRMREKPEHRGDSVNPQNLQTGVQSLQGVQNVQGQVQSLPDRGAKSAPRSEKETRERNLEKDISNIRNDSHQEKEIGETTRERPEESVRSVGDSRTGRYPARRDSSQLRPLHEMIAERTRQPAMEQHDIVLGESAQEVRQEGTPAVRPASQIARKAAMKRVHHDEAYQAIQAYMVDFSREFNDGAPVNVTTKRAYNLFTRSGMAIGAFIEQLYAARAIVKERSANIRSEAKRDPKNPWSVGTKNKVPYFFAIVEDLLGFREESGASAMSPGNR